MTDWTTPSVAHQSVGTALDVVDNLLSYVKEGQGKPSEKERALFAAAVVFTYGIWENFVEQLAIELAERVSADIQPEKVPDDIRRMLEKKTAWELAVSPGWRTIWVDTVRFKAVGDDDGEKFGMNTARAGQVNHLLSLAGVQDAYEGVPRSIVPDHLPGDLSVAEAIDRLVQLRGEIVHTGKVPESLRKRQVIEWRRFAEEAADLIDETCRKQCKRLISRR